MQPSAAFPHEVPATQPTRIPEPKIQPSHLYKPLVLNPNPHLLFSLSLPLWRRQLPTAHRHRGDDNEVVATVDHPLLHGIGGQAYQGGRSGTTRRGVEGRRPESEEVPPVTPHEEGPDTQDNEKGHAWPPHPRRRRVVAHLSSPLPAEDEMYFLSYFWLYMVDVVYRLNRLNV